MTVLIFHGLYFNPKKPPTGPGMIKLQASSSNGVHIDEIQYAGQTIMRNVWMDQDKDPKYKYCPCNRYDRQCTDSQVQDISWSMIHGFYRVIFCSAFSRGTISRTDKASNWCCLC